MAPPTSKITSGPNAGQFPGARVAQFNGALAEGPNIATQFGQTAIQSIRYDAKPDGVAVDKNGSPWFVESDPGNPGYRIARYTPGADHYDEWSLPCGPGSPCSGSFTGTGPRDLTIAADGGVWFTNELKKSFGHFDPATQAMEEYTLASVDPTIGQGIAEGHHHGRRRNDLDRRLRQLRRPRRELAAQDRARGDPDRCSHRDGLQDRHRQPPAERRR